MRARHRQRGVVGREMVDEVPLSLAIAVIATAAVGAVMSMVTDRLPETALMLPAASVAFAVRIWTPSLNATVVIM